MTTRRDMTNLVDITCIVRHETDKAWLIHDGMQEVWIPKSQSELHEDENDTIITMPEWLAREKGLI